MDNVTRQISEFVRSKGFNLSDMSRKTGIPYGALYSSLCNDTRDRDLKADEFLSICYFLEKNPMDFVGVSDEKCDAMDLKKEKGA